MILPFLLLLLVALAVYGVFVARRYVFERTLEIWRDTGSRLAALSAVWSAQPWETVMEDCDEQSVTLEIAVNQMIDKASFRAGSETLHSWVCYAPLPQDMVGMVVNDGQGGNRGFKEASFIFLANEGRLKCIPTANHFHFHFDETEMIRASAGGEYLTGYASVYYSIDVAGLKPDKVETTMRQILFFPDQAKKPLSAVIAELVSGHLKEKKALEDLWTSEVQKKLFHSAVNKLSELEEKHLSGIGVKVCMGAIGINPLLYPFSIKAAPIREEFKELSQKVEVVREPLEKIERAFKDGFKDVDTHMERATGVKNITGIPGGDSAESHQDGTASRRETPLVQEMAFEEAHMEAASEGENMTRVSDGNSAEAHPDDTESRKISLLAQAKSQIMAGAESFLNLPDIRITVTVVNNAFPLDAGENGITGAPSLSQCLKRLDQALDKLEELHHVIHPVKMKPQETTLKPANLASHDAHPE